MTTKPLEDKEFQIVYICSLLSNTQFTMKQNGAKFPPCSSTGGPALTWKSLTRFPLPRLLAYVHANWGFRISRGPTTIPPTQSSCNKSQNAHKAGTTSVFCPARFIFFKNSPNCKLISSCTSIWYTRVLILLSRAVQRTCTTDQAKPEHLTIPFNKLPWFHSSYYFFATVFT